MNGITQRATSPWSALTVVRLALVVLAVSCATMVHPPQAFLSSTDASYNQWLDATVDVDLAEVRIMHLPLTDAFSGLRLAIARADAPVESLKVTLHASQITRRQALWLLSQKYELTMNVQQLPGQPPYISISRE